MAVVLLVQLFWLQLYISYVVRIITTYYFDLVNIRLLLANIVIVLSIVVIVILMTLTINVDLSRDIVLHDINMVHLHDLPWSTVDDMMLDLSKGITKNYLLFVPVNFNPAHAPYNLYPHLQDGIACWRLTQGTSSVVIPFTRDVPVSGSINYGLIKAHYRCIRESCGNGYDDFMRVIS